MYDIQPGKDSRMSYILERIPEIVRRDGKSRGFYVKQYPESQVSHRSRSPVSPCWNPVSANSCRWRQDRTPFVPIRPRMLGKRLKATSRRVPKLTCAKGARRVPNVPNRHQTPENRVRRPQQPSAAQTAGILCRSVRRAGASARCIPRGRRTRRRKTAFDTPRTAWPCGCRFCWCCGAGIQSPCWTVAGVSS